MEWFFLVLLVSGRFGHAKWNGPYIDALVWLFWSVCLVSQSVDLSV